MARRSRFDPPSRPSIVRTMVSPPPLIRALYRVPSAAPGLLGLLEDRRYFHPERAFRPALSFGARANKRLVVKSAPNALRNDISARVGFVVPKKVAVCVRRKQRKEVIHAIGKAGGGGSRRRRRNYWSDVDC